MQDHEDNITLDYVTCLSATCDHTSKAKTKDSLTNPKNSKDLRSKNKSVPQQTQLKEKKLTVFATFKIQHFSSGLCPGVAFCNYSVPTEGSYTSSCFIYWGNTKIKPPRGWGLTLNILVWEKRKQSSNEIPRIHGNGWSLDEAGCLHPQFIDILPIPDKSSADRSPFTSTKYHKAATVNKHSRVSGHLVNPLKTESQLFSTLTKHTGSINLWKSDWWCDGCRCSCHAKASPHRSSAYKCTKGKMLCRLPDSPIPVIISAYANTAHRMRETLRL